MSENILQTLLSVHEQVQIGGLSSYVVLEVDLRKLALADSAMNDVAFRRVCMEHVPARDTTCRDVRFEASRLRGVNFSHSLLTGTRIMNCEAHEICFDSACIIGMQVFDTPMANGVFVNARLDDCVFQSSELYGANFDSALLTHCQFSDPRLENASLNRAIFRRAVLIDVDLRAANLHGADFENALCIGVDFRDANMVRSNIEGATFVACDTTGAVT